VRRGAFTCAAAGWWTSCSTRSEARRNGGHPSTAAPFMLASGNPTEYHGG
jgi:hypothetical protein